MNYKNTVIPALFVFLISTFFAPPSHAQTTTDIFLVDLSYKDGAFTFGEPENITDRDGYDNQPSFTHDGKSILFTSIRDGEQSDTYRYDLSSKKISRVYFTVPESEYSPVQLAGSNAGYYSVIRVEADSAQRLWKIPLPTSGEGVMEVIVEGVKRGGYYAWADENIVAMFVLPGQASGSPVTMQIIDIKTGSVEVIAENIGRSLHKIPDKHAMSFVQKETDGEWNIKNFDIEPKTIHTIVSTLPGKEDYCWTPAGIILMGMGSKLFKFDPVLDSLWSEAADFNSFGITDITRLAVSPDGTKLAIVSAR